LRTKSIILSLLVVSMLVLAGCGQPAAPAKPAATPAPAPAPAPAKTDATTSASVVDNIPAFEKAISKTGVWIICTTKDLKTDKELVLDGSFVNGKKDAAGKDIVQRKIGLYTQDDKHNVTARFTLEAPKLTINSPMASIQYGTFKGDLYVTVNDFQLVDATINGNVYFTTDSAKSTFKMDKTSKVTGKQEVKK
jgi:hypothetical protein